MQGSSLFLMVTNIGGVTMYKDMKIIMAMCVLALAVLSVKVHNDGLPQDGLFDCKKAEAWAADWNGDKADDIEKIELSEYCNALLQNHQDMEE
tara:strand:+ start:1113 stop:1391 length:279 start_codon:yes stop_codon:yes gene_type:complete